MPVIKRRSKIWALNSDLYKTTYALLYKPFLQWCNTGKTAVIAVALGANLPSESGPPLETLHSALKRFPEFCIIVQAISSWYETAPVPVSDQPKYVNGVALIETTHDPRTLLNIMLSIEDEYGRERRGLNAARTIDLDLLDYDGRIEPGPPTLPHPRLQDRAFVLIPLKDVAPLWVHPVTGLKLESLISMLGDAALTRAIS